MDWWHDDPELLRATLSLLASAEVERDPSSEDALPVLPLTVSLDISAAPLISSAPSSTEGDINTKKKPRRVVNVSRERRRDETRYLRAKAMELEAQLATLQQRREHMLRQHRSETGEIRSIAPIWEELATRQVRELRRSKVANAKLKNLLAAQLKVADDLIAAIRRAEDESKRILLEDGRIPASRPRLAIDISQNISEEEQLQRLDVICTQWREAFEPVEKFHDGVSLRFLDMELVEHNGAEALVEVLSSSVVPFPKEAVEEGFWRFFLEEFAGEEDGYAWAQDYQSRDDTIIGVFRALSTIDNHRMTFEGKFVSKRMRSPEGNMLVISNSYSELRCKSKFLDDVSVEEDLWLRIVDSHDVGGPKLSHPLTVMQHVRRMSIRFGQSHFESDSESREAQGKRRHAGALIEFLMRQVEDEMKQGEQYLEGMLLDGLDNLNLSAPVDGSSVVL